MGSEKKTEAAGAWRRAQGIYDDNKGVGGGIWEWRLQQRQQRRRRSIYNASKGLETTTEATAAQQRAQWIGNDDIVSIFLAIASLTVILSRLCLVLILFWYFFRPIPFFGSLQEKLSVLQSCGKYVCTKCTLTLRIYPLRTGELKNYNFSLSIKTYVSP